MSANVRLSKNELMEAHFWMDAHGRSRTLMDAHGRLWTLMDAYGRSWTLIFGWTLMEAHFWMDANGRSFLDGRLWTLMDDHFWMDAHGRYSGVGWTLGGRLRTFGKFGHASVTGRSRGGQATVMVMVTLQIHKK
jgi:hypothetical protein